MCADLYAGSQSRGPLSTFFLIDSLKPKLGLSAIHAWPLVRSALVLALTGLVAGVTLKDETSLIILTDGPLDRALLSDQEALVIRAGHPPSVVGDPASIATVDAEPRWSAAASLGLKLAPEDAQIRVIQSKRMSERVIYANARLSGADVSVSALVAGDGKPTLVAGERRFPLQQRSPDWFTKTKLPAGGAASNLQVANYPLCIPGSALLQADSDWPPDDECSQGAASRGLCRRKAT